MAEAPTIRAVERVEILTLQDNTIDLTHKDDNAVIRRAQPPTMHDSILAEHGFSALITVVDADRDRCMLFDFGFSSHGAAHNADVLGVDLSRVELLALSHGHPDHVGGLRLLVEKTGRTNLPLVVHPAAFRQPRFSRISPQATIPFPPFTRDHTAAAGAAVIATEKPYALLDGRGLFLGQIARTTDFEHGAANLRCEIDGQERQDPFDDDSAVVFNVRGKGLVVLSGCAHAGIVNTVAHARRVTGVQRVMAVMGGFHLSGQDVDAVIRPTVDALKTVAPAYIVPTHCSGRAAVQMIESQLPERFILNMSGTRLTFSA